MMDESEKLPCVIAICKCGCGRVVYANAGELSSAEQREIGKMVAEGYDVLRTTVGDARSREWFCATRKQARMDAEAAKPENVQRRKYEAAMAEMGGAA